MNETAEKDFFCHRRPDRQSQDSDYPFVRGLCPEDTDDAFPKLLGNGEDLASEVGELIVDYDEGGGQGEGEKKVRRGRES